MSKNLLLEVKLNAIRDVIPNPNQKIKCRPEKWKILDSIRPKTSAEAK